MHACIHICVHTYIHTFIHTYIHNLAELTQKDGAKAKAAVLAVELVLVELVEEAGPDLHDGIVYVSTDQYLRHLIKNG